MKSEGDESRTDKKKVKKGRASMGIIKLGSSIFIMIFFIIIPAIPGAVLWWYLRPVMFWEKFAWVVTSMLFYIIILAYIINFILHPRYKEEDEEETIDENINSYT